MTFDLRGMRGIPTSNSRSDAVINTFPMRSDAHASDSNTCMSHPTLHICPHCDLDTSLGSHDWLPRRRNPSPHTPPHLTPEISSHEVVVYWFPRYQLPDRQAVPTTIADIMTLQIIRDSRFLS